LLKGEANMPLTIRKARMADRPVIVEFNQHMALETEGKTLDAAVLDAGVAAVLADPSKGVYFLADDEGTVVGQAMLTYEWSDWRNGCLWWIQSVYVRAEARRQGVFRALYEHIYDSACRDSQVIGLRLYTAADNEGAQRTYRRLGMEATDYRMFQRYPL
jgi:GNAT superfamily N-acetyltransferase